MSSDRRWLIGALAVSLLLNLFLAGVLTGRHLFAPRGPQNAAIMRRGAIRQLPEAERLRFNVVMTAQGASLHAARLHLRQLRQAVRQAIAAPHYDAAEVSRRFAELRAAQMAQETLQQNTLAQALGQLSPTSRASIIQAESETTRP